MATEKGKNTVYTNQKQICKGKYILILQLNAGSWDQQLTNCRYAKHK